MEEIKIKRPPNAFILFSNDNRSAVATSFPHLANTEISSVLGCLWKQLDIEKRNEYFHRQVRAHREHQKLNPNYVYDPNEARVQKSLKVQANHEGGIHQTRLPKVTVRKQIKKGKKQKGGKASTRVKMVADAKIAFQVSSSATSTSSQSQQIPCVINISNSVPRQPTKAKSAGASLIPLNAVSTPPMGLTVPRLIAPKFKFAPLTADIFLQNTYELACPSDVEPCKLIPLTEELSIEPIDNRVYSTITVVPSPKEIDEQNGGLTGAA